MKAKRKLRQSHSPKLRQKQILRYGAAAAIALSLVAGAVVFFYLNIGNTDDTHAAGGRGYTSLNNYTGIWDDVATWIKDQTWMNNVPNYTGGHSQYIDIYGYITREGDLSIGGTTNMTIYDTLRVKGNFDLRSSSKLTIEPGGVLIIEGSFTNRGATKTKNEESVVILGDLTASGIAKIDNNQNFYVYGNSSGTGHSKFNNSRNNPSNSNFGDEADLTNNDMALYNFVNEDISTLPVEFKSVKVELSGNKLIISWQTASEINNDFFTIEASSKGKNFESIGNVKGAGNSNQTLSYQFAYQKPKASHKFFRVKQTDFDGKFDYSKIVSFINPSEKNVLPGGLTLVSVGPNPFTQAFTINFEVPQEGIVEFRLLNQQGIAVASETTEAGKGNNRYEFVDQKGLQPGLYLLILIQNNASTKAIRIIKN